MKRVRFSIVVAVVVAVGLAGACSDRIGTSAPPERAAQGASSAQANSSPATQPGYSPAELRAKNPMSWIGQSHNEIAREMTRQLRSGATLATLCGRMVAWTGRSDVRSAGRGEAEWRVAKANAGRDQSVATLHGSTETPFKQSCELARGFYGNSDVPGAFQSADAKLDRYDLHQSGLFGLGQFGQ